MEAVVKELIQARHDNREDETDCPRADGRGRQWRGRTVFATAERTSGYGESSSWTSVEDIMSILHAEGEWINGAHLAHFDRSWGPRMRGLQLGRTLRRSSA